MDEWWNWLSAGPFAWRDEGIRERLLEYGSVVFLLAFAVIYWTRLGTRWTAVKCLALAILLHFLAWGYAGRLDLATIVAPTVKKQLSERRMPIQLAARDRERAEFHREVDRIRRLMGEGLQRPTYIPDAASPAKADLPRREIEDRPADVVESKVAEPTLPVLEPSSIAPTMETATKRPEMLPPLAAAPAKQPTMAPTPAAAESLVASAPKVERRNYADPLPSRNPLPRDAVAAEVSEARLGPSVERLTAEPSASASAPRLSTATPRPGSLGLVAPVMPRRSTDKVVASSRPMSPVGKAGGADPLDRLNPRGRDVELVINRAEQNRKRLLDMHGGSAKTEVAVQEALAWLAAHQDRHGRWSCTNFMARCPDGDKCDGIAIEKVSDVGVTGLALLAFLGAGHTRTPGDPYAEVVGRAIDWLLLRLEADGNLMGEGIIYSHAMATLALTEALALTGDPNLRTPCNKAIAYLVNAQHEDTGGWRYAPGQTGDTSVFGWVILALRSAEHAGIKVPETTWLRARRWLAAVSTGPNGGLAIYQPRYPISHAMTAEALVCRQFFGVDRADKSQEEAGDYLLTRLPSVDDYHLYYWYYGAIGTFQLGGVHWQRWNERMKATLLSTQVKSGHARGSWTPEKPFGVDGGRVFTTACSALCLEVYYRYLPLYQSSGR